MKVRNITEAANDENEDTKDKGKIRVFVYGTLKSTLGNHKLISNSDGEFLGLNSTTGAYQMFNMGGFPAVMSDALHTNDSIQVRGELWTINDAGLAALDLLEGNPLFFSRRKIWTDNPRKRAWMYFLTEGWRDEVRVANEVPHCLWKPTTKEEIYWELPTKAVA